jgi:hypothetical protein
VEAVVVDSQQVMAKQLQQIVVAAVVAAVLVQVVRQP